MYNRTLTSASPSRLEHLQHKIEVREARIGIVGMGYVGFPSPCFSVASASASPDSTCLDKVKTLNTGGSYIVRILPEAIQEAQKSGFHATSDYSEIANMDAVIICVPTPLNEYHEPDLSYVTGTVESIAPHVREGQLIVLESTTYPGTTEEIVVPLLEKGNRHGLKVARKPRRSGCSRRVLTRARGPGQRNRGTPRYPQSRRWVRHGRCRACRRFLRHHLPPSRSGQQPVGRRDDQAA